MKGGVGVCDVSYFRRAPAYSAPIEIMQSITTYRRDLLNPLKKACVSWEVRQSEYVNVNYIFDLG